MNMILCLDDYYYIMFIYMDDTRFFDFPVIFAVGALSNSCPVQHPEKNYCNDSKIDYRMSSGCPSKYVVAN